MIDMRAEKTTRNADDFKVLITGAVCAILILMGSVILPRFSEQRWYRDITRLTPFYDVQLLYSTVSGDEISISIGGSLVKRRCDFNNLFGYIYGDNGIRYRVPVDTKDEPVKGNRPPSNTPESWGPWTLSIDDNPNIPLTVMPVSYEVIAEHIVCPTEPKTQRNLFLKGEWENFIFDYNKNKSPAIIEEITKKGAGK
ncbi:hypothetical protein SUFG_00005 [Sulfitobacter phage phiCB2047-B]|uniref:Uncharacterized protein n=1 Tax=Sulfitobacter phage phiCB2047-B TaxID=754046 RepID=M4PMW8_9CAUD|nr:hypothetical protein SUFG_00005 [Sulfitobacter phage phiCB2047-B]AGH07378.1 hypothetical protein SUFG_00005 [Sulfitobacter phage phiCB2047-B]